MRLPRLASLLLLLWGACRGSETVPEAGAILLQVKNGAGTQLPDELRVWVYDETGVLWNGVRIPEQGSLVPQGQGDLGTILLQPGTIHGSLRIHLKGMAAGMRTSDGLLVVATLSGSRIIDIVLEVAEPPDTDADGVPDGVDDCASMPNPRQGGCPLPTPDAGPDVPFEETLVAAAADSAGETGATPDLGFVSDDRGEEGVSDRGIGEDSRLPEPDAYEPDDPGGGAEDAPPSGDDVASIPADDVLSPATEVPRTAEDASQLVADVAPATDSRPDTDTITEDGGDDGAVVLGDSGDASSSSLPQGSPCSQNEACASGSCADGVCCTNACLGPCRSCNQPNADGVCQAYAAGTDPESECGGATCNGAGACGTGPPTSRSNGELCTSPSQCLSGFCTDGVCCNSACKDPCQSCGSGACKAIYRSDDIPECTGDRTCSKKGSCVGS